MQQLVWKEFILQRKWFLLYLILPISAASKHSNDPLTIAVTYFSTCIVMFWVSFYTEGKNKTDILLTSLPFRKREIVIGKYLSALLFIVAGAMMNSIIIVCVQWFLREEIGIPFYAIFLGVFMAMLYVSLALLVSYGGSTQFSFIFSLIIYFPSVGALGFMSNVLADPNLTLMFFNTANVTLVISIFSAVACFVYALSMIISIAAFEAKEL